ncbi:MAG: hypothetical protein ACREP2_00025 [Rhodanobacteraceae bacterium]
MIGATSFVIGFAAAAALAGGFVAWVYAGGQSARQSWVIDPLVANAELLDVTDQRPQQLTRVIIGQVRDNSLAAAAQFDRLTKLNQRIVLRQFAKLNRSATLRADAAPYAKTVRLARVMVLCSHTSATPGWLTIDQGSGGMTPVPEWVLDPNAKPVMPVVGSIVGSFQQSAAVIAAERKHWGKLHQWVIAHHACIRQQDAALRQRSQATTQAGT